MADWIACSERLPEHLELVLLYFPVAVEHVRHGMLIDYSDKGYPRYWRVANVMRSFESVSHWAEPLPPPPAPAAAQPQREGEAG